MQRRTRPGYEALLAAEYRKSSASSGAQECIAVGRAADLAGVMDTKNEGTILAFPANQFALFISAAKLGKNVTV